MPRDDHVAAARDVYDASSNRYVDFVGTEISAATESAVDRALLAAFVELVEAGGGRRVGDLGCGPGRVAAYLARHGLDVVGIDVSEAMIAEARRAHPALEFIGGRLDDLPLADAALAGAVCWYSIIYTPPEGLDQVLAELRRVLAPGGQLLLGFQSGDGDASHVANAYGTELPLTSYRHRLDDVSRRLDEAGFAVHATVERAAELDHENSPQGFVFAKMGMSPESGLSPGARSA